MANEIYNFLKQNNLTQKSEQDFIKEYSNPDKAKELHGFLQQNNLTKKDSAQFYNEYFKPQTIQQPKQTTTNGIGVLKNQLPFKAVTDFQQSIVDKVVPQKNTENNPIVGIDIPMEVVKPKTQTVYRSNTFKEEVPIKTSAYDVANAMSTEQLLTANNDVFKTVVNQANGDTGLDEFNKQSDKNNNIQAFNRESELYNVRLKTLKDRAGNLERVLASKYQTPDFMQQVKSQMATVKQKSAQYDAYVQSRSKEVIALQTELEAIVEQGKAGTQPIEVLKPAYDAKKAQLYAIQRDDEQKRSEIEQLQNDFNGKLDDPDFALYSQIYDKINELSGEQQGLISKPEFAEYRKLLDEGDKAQAKKDAMKKAYQSKGILGKASDIMGALSQLSPIVMVENLITGESDKTFTGAKIADEGDKLLGRTLKALASVPKMLDISNPIGDENKYDVFDKMFDQAIYASKKRDILNPTATDVQRDIIQKYADVGGYRVMLDENGKPTNDVRDASFYKVNDKTQKEITDKYNENPTAYKTEKDFSASTLTTKATPTILDMGTMMATAMLSGGTTGLVAGAGTAGTVSTATTVGVSAAQMYGDMYESGLSAGLTPQEANDFATLTSIMTGMVSLVNPMESNIVRGVVGRRVGQILGESLTLADVQLVRSGQMSIGQLAKRTAIEGVKNTFGENLEELVLEPAVQRATETYYNTKAQKNGQQGFEDLNKPFFDTKQTIETAMITSMTSLLITPIEVSHSIPEQRKIALQNALDNPQQFLDMRDKMLQSGDIEKGKYDYEVKAFEEISKQYNAVKPSINEDLHDDLAELLLKKYTLKNTMSQVNDEVLNKKNQLLLDDINKRLEEVADGTYNKGKEKALSNIANPNTLIEEDKIATYNGAEVTILDDLANGEVVINTNNPEIGEDGIITVEKSTLTDVRNKPKDIEQLQITNAVININGKEYEGKNHAEAILKAQADGQDISQVDRQAEGLFKLSDGTIINREQAKEQFGQDRSELIIPQDEASNQANVEYKRIQDEQKNPITPVEPINAGQELNNGTGIQQADGNGGEIQQGDGIGQVSGQEVPTEKVEERVIPTQQSGEVGSVGVGGDVGSKSILKSDVDLKGDKKKSWMRKNSLDKISVNDINEEGHNNNLSSAKENVKAGKKSQTKEAPLVEIDENGNATIIDGHHRIAEDILDGKSHIEAVVDNKFNIRDAIKDGLYEKAISEGRMTAKDAKEIIESAGLKVPKEIESLLSKEQPKAEPQKKVEQVSATQKTKQPPISKTETTENPALKDVESTTKALDELPKDNLEFISRKENNRRKSGFYEKAKGVLFKGFGGNASVISDKFGSKYKYFTDNPDYAKSFSLEKEYLTQKGKVEKYQTDYKREYNTNEKHYNEEVLNHSGKKSYIDLTSKDYDNFNDKLKDDGYDVVNIKRTEPLIPSESYRGHSANIRNVEVEEHLILNDNSIKKISDQPILLKNNSKAISEAYHKAKADGSNPELVKAVEEALTPTPEVSKPVSEIAKTPISKTETTERKLKNDKHDRMVGLMREYNSTPANKKTRKSEIRQSINKLASDLGYTVKGKTGDKIDVLNAKGKVIRKINITSDEVTVTPEVIEKTKELAQGWFEWNGNELDYHIDASQLGLTWQEIRRAKADIDAGKTESTNINRVANAINEYGNMESLPLVRGFGGNYEYTEVTGKDLEYFNDIDNTKEAPSPYGDDLFQQTDKSFTPISESVFTKLLDKLKMAFPNVKVELFGKKDFENAKKELQDKGIIVTDTKTKDGTIYGFKTPDGKVFINTDNLNANTPIHEFGHIWQSVFPQEFARGIELLKLSPQGQALIREIQKNPAYKGKSLAEIQAEALVTAIGNKGEAIFNSNPTLFNKFKEWLSDFFKKIGDKLGIKDLSADDKLNMFTKKVVGELLGGKELSKNVGKSNDVELQSVNNPSKEEIGKAYILAQAYLEATDFEYNTEARDEFIEKVRNNPLSKAIFTETQLEKIYDGQVLSSVDKIRVKYKMLIYDIKNNNRLSKQQIQQKQQEMADDIKWLINNNLKSITGKQAEKFINLANKAVTNNSPAYLARIINQIANLADQRTYQKAKTLYEVIKARSKRKGGVQSGKLTGVLQDFATINPLDVSDIAKYVELAEKVKQASNVVKQPTDADSDLVYDEVQAYVKAQQDEINSNAINDTLEDDAMTFFTVLDNKTKAKFGDDKTFDDLNEVQQREVFESITKDDIKKYGLTDEERDMVEAFKEIKTEQKRQDFITATYVKIGELKDLLANSVGVITQSPAEKEITDALLDVKLDDMTATEMARVLKLINGITQNNDYSGGGAFVAQQKSVEVNSKMNALKSEIGEFRKLSEGGSKFRNFQQISVAMAKGKKLGAKLMEASGINNLMRGIAKTKTYSHNLQKAFKAEKFKSSVFEPISQMRQSIYAAVIQTKIGDDVKEAEHIERWKRIIEKNIENLRTINKDGYKEQAELLQKALDEVIGDRQQLKDIADNMSKIDSEGKRVVQFFTDNHAEQKPRFRENSLLFHNKEIEEYNSYTKLSITSLTGDTVRDTGEKLMNDARSTGITKKKSKSMIDRANYESLNDNTGLDFNFINKQMKALGDNEYDINTSADITTLANAFNSDNKQLRELLGAENFDLLKKRLQTIVGTSKYEETTVVDDLLNEATKISRTIALGSITQVLKQSTVLMSTYLNSAGKGNIKGLDFTMLFGSKRQKENLQKLFAQSEIGARRAEGAGGYYDNTTIKKNISDGNAKKIIKVIGKGKDFFSDLSMYPLRSFDILAADISWITFYKKYLRDNNLVFDENNEFKNPNKEAMAYAETMVQTAQGANTEAGQAEVWGSAKGLTQLALPFMSFAVQAKARLVDNVMNIYNGDDRVEAGRDIGAYVTEQIAFNAVKLGIGTVVATQLIPALLKELGLGDDDEDTKGLSKIAKEKIELEKLRKAEQIKSSFVNNIVQDLTYGTIPMVDNMATKPAINFLYNHIFKTNTGIIPEYNRSTDFNILSGGTVGVGYNQLLNLKDDINIITDNNAFGDYKSQSQVSVFTYNGKDYTIVHNGRYTRRDMFFNNVKGRMDVSNSSVPADILKAFVENPSDFKLKEELRKTGGSQDGDLQLNLTDEQKTYAKIMLMADLLTFYGINETVFNQINNKVRGEMKKQIIKK